MKKIVIFVCLYPGGIAQDMTAEFVKRCEDEGFVCNTYNSETHPQVILRACMMRNSIIVVYAERGHVLVSKLETMANINDSQFIHCTHHPEAVISIPALIESMTPLNAY